MIRRIIESGLARAIPWGLLMRRRMWQVTRPISIGVRALVIEDGRLLLVRGHGQSFWTLPGGSVQRRELLAETAIREVREETGCIVRVDRLLGMYSHFLEGKSDHVAVFVCYPIKQTTLRLNIEIVEARFWSMQDLPLCVADVQKRLDDYHTASDACFSSS
ncbi:MAG: hypothetical protein NVSMB42_18800 [Herpetosiphon sp.]